MATQIPDLALKRWNPDVRASGESDATISILEQIGEDYWGEGVTSRRVSAALRAIGERDVTVTINSPGGNYFEGLSIYNILREHKGHVTVKIVGIAASAASVIAMAGDTIKIARAGFLMIHNAAVLDFGDQHAKREVADWLEPFDATAADIYHARTGIEVTEVREMLNRETWIGGKDAVDQGFADDFLDADEISASVVENSGGAALKAERRLRQILQKQGVSRSEERQLLASLKGGKSGAAPSGMQDAAVSQALSGFLSTLKS
ncbi:head maturation protease, ClpP-related [Thioclava sp. GXIMD2076]|uniref:head maturation protease, ClpP-related n=1 Tax=Thioclava sp. GXIMD2076 TaxID=3131931 RepID=UPI0030D08373